MSGSGPWHDPSSNEILATARRYKAAGLSFLPISDDGSKTPDGRVLPQEWDEGQQRYKSTWKPYQERQPTDVEVVDWYGNGIRRGIAWVCGEVSGKLEIIDGDDLEVLAAYHDLVRTHAPDLYKRLTITETGSGCNHFLYRCEKIEGNQKLALRLVSEEVPEGTKGAKQGDDGRWYRHKKKTLIETRGPGGYAVAPGGPLSVHDSGRPYRFIQGDETTIPTITVEQRDLLFNLARALNECEEKEGEKRERTEYKKAARSEADGLRPGDDYNERGNPLDVLLNHSWTVSRMCGSIYFLRKPGKKERGHQATLNAVAPGVFWCFSTSAAPFEDNKPYSPFQVYAILEHNGDFNEAARTLATMGYGSLPVYVGPSDGRAIPLDEDETMRDEPPDPPDPPNGNPPSPGGQGQSATPPVSLKDFIAHSPTHTFIYHPTREFWSPASVNSRIEPVKVGTDPTTGADILISASKWLDQNRAVEQMTWMPGEPPIIRDKLIAEGGWLTRKGARCYNLYRPPRRKKGDPADVDTWLNHVVKIYPEDWPHILAWLAHRVQRSQEKINHALVLGGGQGIGKDTLLEPVKWAVGHWNFIEIGPHHLLGRFNGFARSVVLRISEARDLGDVDRYSFYERTKIYTAAPPDMLRVDEKNMREYQIPNICGVIITTNHTDGLYLPSDDRRHYVAWSESTKEDFDSDYWVEIYKWLEAGGKWNVAAYLAVMDNTEFNPKAPPPHSAGWKMMVDAGQAPECAELSDIIDSLGDPDAFTLEDLTEQARTHNGDGLYEWLKDRKNRRAIPHRLEEAGYVRVHNGTRKDGLWIIDNRRQAIYAKRQLTINERLRTARDIK